MTAKHRRRIFCPQCQTVHRRNTASETSHKPNRVRQS